VSLPLTVPLLTSVWLLSVSVLTLLSPVWKVLM